MGELDDFINRSTQQQAAEAAAQRRQADEERRHKQGEVLSAHAKWQPVLQRMSALAVEAADSLGRKGVPPNRMIKYEHSAAKNSGKLAVWSLGEKVGSGTNQRYDGYGNTFDSGPRPITGIALGAKGDLYKYAGEQPEPSDFAFIRRFQRRKEPELSGLPIRGERAHEDVQALSEAFHYPPGYQRPGTSQYVKPWLEGLIWLRAAEAEPVHLEAVVDLWTQDLAAFVQGKGASY
jgi:hypothetical protein